MRKKILIGHVVFINQIGVVKCGGVVVNVEKINLVVNLINMSQKTMKKIQMMKKRKMKQKNKSYLSILSVFVVKKLDIELINV
jgi:hypothetical protein